MKIILEGVDGSGKTTLANILAFKYGLDICHCTQHDPGDYDFYKQTARKENVVWDRHTIGELIYPTIFDRKQKISTEDARLALSYLRNDGGKVLVLTGDLDIIRNRLIKRGGEDQRILNNLEWIDSQFRTYAAAFNVTLIDTSKTFLGDIFDYVESSNSYRLIFK